MKRIERKKIIFVFLWGLVVFSILASNLLSYYFINNMPKNPQPKDGRIYALNVHGWTAYLTYSEKVLHNCLFWMGGISAIAAVIFGLFFVMPGQIRQRQDREAARCDLSTDANKHSTKD